MPSQFDPASGTRDFLAAEVEQREHAFGVIRSVFTRYGFEPLQTPAFERLDVLLGKYGDEGDKLVFKILRRGEHEASGEADLALRYDQTVPLARVAAAYGSQLPSPYKRYAMGPVWRADRPGKDRYREFVQCDLDTLGSASPLADAEVLCAHHDAVAELGIGDFRVAAELAPGAGRPAGGVRRAGRARYRRADLAGQAGQAPARRGDGGARGARPGSGPGRRARRRDDRAGRRRPDQGRAQAERRGQRRPGRGRPGAVAGGGAASAGADRVHAAPGARPELLHRADLGAGRSRGGGLARRGRTVRPPDRAARRPGRARDRQLDRRRADPDAAAGWRGGGGAASTWR